MILLIFQTAFERPYWCLLGKKFADLNVDHNKRSLNDLPGDINRFNNQTCDYMDK